MNTFPVDTFAFKPVSIIIALLLIVPFLSTMFVTYFSTGSISWKLPLIVLTVTAPLAILFSIQLAIAEIIINDRQLIVGGGVYKEAVDFSEIRFDAIIKIDLSKNTQVLGVRINGIGLPGFYLGWFQSYSGRKVFALVTNKDAVFVPTTKPYDILVSPSDTDQFISVLNAKK